MRACNLLPMRFIFSGWRYRSRSKETLLSFNSRYIILILFWTIQNKIRVASYPMCAVVDFSHAKEVSVLGDRVLGSKGKHRPCVGNYENTGKDYRVEKEVVRVAIGWQRVLVVSQAWLQKCLRKLSPPHPFTGGLWQI